MANAFSLTNQGSVPSQFSSPTYNKNISGIKINQPIEGSTTKSGLVGGGPTGNNPVMTNPAPRVVPGLLTNPSTPVKSITHNAADGTTTTTAFHAPITSGSSNKLTSSSTPTPKAGLYSGTTGLTANGLTPQQVGQGYSTIPGQFNPVTGQPNAKPVTSSASTPNTSTQSNPDGTPVSQANAYQNSAAQTDNEKQFQQGVAGAGGMTPEERFYTNAAIQSTELNNHNALDPYAESQFYNGQNGAQFGESLAAPDLAGRAAGNAALSSGVGNIFGSAALQGLSAAQTQASRNLSAQENAYAGAQTQAGRQTTAQGNIFNASIPQSIAPGNSLYNPLTGTSVNGATPSAFSGGVTQGQVANGQQYAANLSAYNQASTVKSQIDTFIQQNPNINPSSFTDVNSVLQLINGKTSNPQQQILSNYLNEYISTLAPILGVGGDATNLKTELAQGMVNAKASGQSISQVLDGIESLAKAKLQAQYQSGTGSTAAPMTTSTALSGWGWTGQ